MLRAPWVVLGAPRSFAFHAWFVTSARSSARRTPIVARRRAPDRAIFPWDRGNQKIDH